MTLWPFNRKRETSPSDAARSLAKLGHDQRRAKTIAAMNVLRDELGMPRFQSGREGA